MIKTRFISIAVLGVMILTGCSNADGHDVEDHSYTGADLDKFAAAMISVGCVVIPQTENATKVKDATGFSNNKLASIVEHLMEINVVVYAENFSGIKLISEGCP